MTDPVNDLCQLTAVQTASAIREGRASCREVAEAHLAQIYGCEADVLAWAFLDRDHVLAQADAAQDHINMGRALGPLHGVPIGVKDIIDTADMPTECGSPVFAGNRPDQDATLVAQLRQAGAIIMGKTVTTELALYTPGKTRNPNNSEHTPGGSSSGSAAAVAAHMVPGAIGTQTNGSVIRPAAFCGVVGYKPSRGLISRHGVLCQAPSLDTVGVMARSVEDVALIGEQIMAYDANDKSLSPRARPDLLAHAQSEPPYQPRLALARTPVWDQADRETQEAFAELVEALGEHVIEMALPDSFDRALDLHRIVMEAEIGHNFGAIHKRARAQLSPRLCDIIEHGQTIPAAEYLAALDSIPPLVESLESAFDWVDAFITPAAPGAAPHGLASTGSPVFCTLWTLTGMPAITLPLLQSSAGLPIGVQLVGQFGRDARLLRTARWLVDFLAED